MIIDLTLQLSHFLPACFFHPGIFPCNAISRRLSWKRRSNGYILSGGRLTGNGFSNELVKHSSVDHPMLYNHLLLLTQHVFQHIAQPFLPFFFAWLLLIFLPYFNFCISDFKCWIHHSQFAICISDFIYFFTFLKGIPSSFNNSYASSSVLAVVTNVISIPVILFTLSISISGKMICSVTPSV